MVSCGANGDWAHVLFAGRRAGSTCDLARGEEKLEDNGLGLTAEAGRRYRKALKRPLKRQDDYKKKVPRELREELNSNSLR
jgi:hypothetical protein